jgi:hypothetical protein
LRLGWLLDQQSKHLEAIDVWMSAFAYDPDRVEGLVYSMHSLFSKRLYTLVCDLYKAHGTRTYAFNPDKVFIDPQEYDLNVEFLYAMSALHLGRLQDAWPLTQKLLSSKTLQHDMTIYVLEQVSNFYPILSTKSQDDLLLIVDSFSNAAYRLVK